MVRADPFGGPLHPDADGPDRECRYHQNRVQSHLADVEGYDCLYRVDTLRGSVHAERDEVVVIVRQQDARGQQCGERGGRVVVGVAVADLQRARVELPQRPAAP